VNNLPEEDKEDDSAPLEVSILRNLQINLKIPCFSAQPCRLLGLCVSGEMESL
jgi:hypothetical protein